ncbi:MAG: hypothetical protein Kilf2KO_11380 [Rhodospirillales bacterium]
MARISRVLGRPAGIAGLLICALLASGCQKRSFAPAEESGPRGPIAGAPLGQSQPLITIGYDEGPSLAGYWWRFSAEGKHLDVGKRPASEPSIMLDLNGTNSSFDWDPVTESYKLQKQADLGEGYSRFFGLTPGNRSQEPYGLMAFTDEGGEAALYGLLGEKNPAPSDGVEHFSGGTLLSRREGSSPVPTVAAKAQARLEGARRPQRLALLITVPTDLPRLFGRRVGAIQLLADYDPATLTFRAADRAVEGVGAGATGRLRLSRFSLVAQVMNDGDSLAGLYRLSKGDGSPIVVGAFTLQSTDRGGVLTSQR